MDRDDDIGCKADIATPIIGREKNIDAAVRLASEDPEDTDINTIFGAIRIYDELVSKGEEVEIVTVSGDVDVGIKSDRKIASEMDALMRKSKADSAIVVTDGAEDESIIPIIQSRIKIDSVRRIVVKQSQNIESTFYLLRRMLSEPRVSRMVLVPVGLAFLAIAISLLSGYTGWAVGLIIGFVGIYALFHGLGWGNTISDFGETLRQSLYRGQITFVTYVAAIVVGIIATTIGLTAAWEYHMESAATGSGLITKFINESIWWYISAFLLSSTGRIVNAYIENRSWEHWSVPFFVLASGLVLWGGSMCVLLFETDFGGGVLYLLGSVVGAIIVSLLGIRLSNYVKSRKKG